jgi:hypothetical protein
MVEVAQRPAPSITLAKPPRRRRANCGEVAQGNATIHRDGFGLGPEVALCDACGCHALPSREEIWSNIARRLGGES